jgi:hypothetical protein
VEHDGLPAEAREHAEGEWFVFDDEHRHFATNRGSTARYALHLTFPDPSANALGPQLSAPILTVCTANLRWRFHAVILTY